MVEGGYYQILGNFFSLLKYVIKQKARRVFHGIGEGVNFNVNASF